MEENKELNEKGLSLSQRVNTVRECFKTIKELGKIGSITERALVHFFIANGMEQLNEQLEEMAKIMKEENEKMEQERHEKNLLS